MTRSMPLQQRMQNAQQKQSTLTMKRPKTRRMKKKKKMKPGALLERITTMPT